MGAYDDKVSAGHKPNEYFAVTSSTTALIYSPKQGTAQREITSVRIQNNSVTSGENITVSLDNGSNFFAINPLGNYDAAAHSVREIQIKSATGTPSYDLWFTTRP